jgi:hypothetical protein
MFYVYRENQLKGTFQINSDLEDFPESFKEVFRPLEIFHDGSGQMLLVVEEGHQKDQSYLATYIIEIDRLISEKIASTVINSSFDSTSRTKSNLLIFNSEKLSFTALNPKDLTVKTVWQGKDNSWSINDDFVLNEKS